MHCWCSWLKEWAGSAADCAAAVCLSMSLLKDPILQLEPGRLHPTVAERKVCPPAPDPAAYVLGAQDKAQNSPSPAVFLCQSVLFDSGIFLGLGARKECEYLRGPLLKSRVLAGNS